jgi:hypothetical protein
MGEWRAYLQHMYGAISNLQEFCTLETPREYMAANVGDSEQTSVSPSLSLIDSRKKFDAAPADEKLPRNYEVS